MWPQHQLLWKVITADVIKVDTANKYHDHVVKIMEDLDGRYKGLGTRAKLPDPWGLFTPLSNFLKVPIPDKNGPIVEAIGCFYTDVIINGVAQDIPRRIILISRTGKDAVTNGWEGMRIEMIGVSRLKHPDPQEWTDMGEQWVGDFRDVILSLGNTGVPMGPQPANGEFVVTATRPITVNSLYPHLQVLYDNIGDWLADDDEIDVMANQNWESYDITITLNF